MLVPSATPTSTTNTMRKCSTKIQFIFNGTCNYEIADQYQTSTRIRRTRQTEGPSRQFLSAGKSNNSRQMTGICAESHSRLDSTGRDFVCKGKERAIRTRNRRCVNIILSLQTSVVSDPKLWTVVKFLGDFLDVRVDWFRFFKLSALVLAFFIAAADHP